MDKNPQYRANQYEHSVVYMRPDGRMEIALTHLPGKTPILTSSLVRDEEGCVDPLNEGILFDLEEARIRYEFLQRLKADGLI